MPEAALVLSPAQPAALRALADTLAHELGLQGVPSTVHLGAFPPSRPDQVWILLNPRQYVACEGNDALPGAAGMRRTICVCEERPPAERDDEDWLRLDRAGALFTLDAHDRRELALQGLHPRLLRPGYSGSLDRYSAVADRPIDVAFTGERTDRTAPLLADAAEVLAGWSCRLDGAERSGTAGSPGPAPAELLAQSKLIISLQPTPDRRLRWREVIDAVHCGAVVVSEHGAGIAPFIAGEHLLVAGPHAVGHVAAALLRQPERLAAIRAAAYERLSAWIPYALPVSVLRASIVELVGEPEPQPVARTA